LSQPVPERSGQPLAAQPGPLPNTWPNRTVRVAAPTAVFWVIKVLTTGMGETASDFLARAIAPEIAVALAGLVLGALLVAQLRSSTFRPWLYWATVAGVGVFGTMTADAPHVVLGVPYLAAAITFAAVVGVLLAVWRRVEGTLDVHGITTRRREAFYWATVLATFAFGTAVGDLTANTLGLGYLASGLLFTAAIAVPALAHRAGLVGPVAGFWAAYVLTRPLGASFADWAAVAPERGGLGWGTGPITIVLAVVIVVAVTYVQVRHARTAHAG
jgi:uncharacterized membrane-anchored protein